MALTGLANQNSYDNIFKKIIISQAKGSDVSSNWSYILITLKNIYFCFLTNVTLFFPSSIVTKLLMKSKPQLKNFIQISQI